jgi:hypothetical protein
MADLLRRAAGLAKPEGHVDSRKQDEWTIDRWRLEPPALQLDESPVVDQSPPLWKDLTLALVMALLLWILAVAMFR